MKGDGKAGCASVNTYVTAHGVQRRTLGGLPDRTGPCHYGVDINDPWREKHNALGRVTVRKQTTLHAEYN